MNNNMNQLNSNYYGYCAPGAMYPRGGVEREQHYAQPTYGYLKGRPVVSIDEARASQIDLDGSLYVFPDLSNKRIYTKQINMDGTATFNVYELSPEAVYSNPVPQENYVTQEQLQSAIAELKTLIPQRITFNTNSQGG